MKKRPWKTGKNSINTNIEHESGIQAARIALNMTWDELRISTGQSHTTNLMRLSTGEDPPTYEAAKSGHYAGEVKQLAIDVSEALGVPLEDLFPRYICRIKTDPDDLTDDQLKEFTVGGYSATAADGGRHTEESETTNSLHRAITEALATLKPREEVVLRKRFGIDGQEAGTLQQVSTLMGTTTKERVRQIEAKALRKLRHPSIKKTLIQ